MIKLFKISFALAIALALPAVAQNNLTYTSLAAAVSDKSVRTIVVGSATGITAGSTQLYIDRELMDVTSVNGTTIGVRRGAAGTSSATHAASTQVYAGPGPYFSAVDRSGSCVAASELVLPIINVKNGTVYDCKSSVWEKASQMNLATLGYSFRLNHTVMTLAYAGTSNLGNYSVVATRGLTEIDTATTVGTGYVYGTEGKVRVKGTLAGSSWVFGVLGQLDISAATLTSGSHVGSIWADAGATGPSASVAFADMIVITNTTATTFNSLIYGYGKAAYFLDLSNNGSAFIVGSAKGSGWDKSLKIKINGTDYYIPLNSAAS